MQILRTIDHRSVLNFPIRNSMLAKLWDWQQTHKSFTEANKDKPLKTTEGAFHARRKPLSFSHNAQGPISRYRQIRICINRQPQTSLSESVGEEGPGRLFASERGLRICVSRQKTMCENEINQIGAAPATGIRLGCTRVGVRPVEINKQPWTCTGGIPQKPERFRPRWSGLRAGALVRRVWLLGLNQLATALSLCI